jgi:enamine deaminase RidA (YjgF/YER057c/UK114 family)
LLASGTVALAALATTAAAQSRREIQPDPRSGRALAVVIGESALVHTGTVVARDKTGALSGGADAGGQITQVLANIEAAFRLAGSSMADVAKLNLSVSDPAGLAAAEQALAGWFTGKPLPAVTLVVSDQPVQGALASGDGIALVRQSPSGVQWLTAAAPRNNERTAKAGVLPKGPIVFFSGKGGRGDARQVAETLLAELKKSMDWMVMPLANVVHVTVLLQDMASIARVEEVLERFFGGKVPPVSYLERQSGAGAMEIEWVAAGASSASKPSQQIEYLTPPHLQPSPMFSQIVRVNRGGLIFVSGTYGNPADDAEAQATALFARLQEAISAAGGDFRHLAKAIYHLSSNDAAAGMDKVRRKVFDPQRPPAASRNRLRHVGGAGGVMVADMIGVVVEK